MSQVNRVLIDLIKTLASRRWAARLTFFRKLAAAPRGNLASIIFRYRCSEVDAGGANRSWCHRTKALLSQLNLDPWWHTMERDPPTKEEWRATVQGAVMVRAASAEETLIANSSSLIWYRKLGRSWGDDMPKYLDDRSALQGARLKTQLRLGCLPLMRQTARQLGWPDDGAVCPLCDTGAVEDIPHFLQCCPAFSRERQVLLAILKDRLTSAGSPGLMALSQFSGGGEQQLLLMLGAKPRFQTPKHLEEEDEEEREVRLQNQGKAWWTLDKACKNFVRVCLA